MGQPLVVGNMSARIYRPAKTAMQSGRGNTREWMLEFDAEDARQIDSLMGWTSSSDTGQQVALKFPNCEAAVAFAQRYGMVHSIEEPREPRVRRRAYADNFRHDRVG